MKLKDVDAVLEIIDDITEIRGTTYIELVERIEKLPTIAVIHDCNGCMGSAYNPRDCETCEKVQITGKEKEMIEIVKTDQRDGWIPVTEQEPPEDHVLLTLKHSDDDYEVTELDYGVGKAMMDEKHPKIMREHAASVISKIIAWMPMPEPYKED